MVSVEQNAQSFNINDLHYGDKVTIGVNGAIVQEFVVQLSDAKLGLYLNKVRKGWV